MPNHTLRNYATLPPVLLNLWAVALYVPYYALTATRPDLVAGISPGQITLINYAFLVVLEWTLAIGILRRDGTQLRQLLSRDCRLLSFARPPALAAVAGVLLISVAYFALASGIYGDTLANSYIGLGLWERILLITVLPITAAFCEELVWRAFLPREMERRGWSRRRIVILSSLSFAAIHGIFFPDKLIWTFLFGAILAMYYLKQRNLLPAIAVHWMVDVGSFAWLLFA